MTEKLYYKDAYLTEFEAGVLSCTQSGKLWLAELDRTAFYPEGGGQPADTGTLGGAKVTDVQEKEGHILHTCSAPLVPGSRVAGRIDWERRFDHMQQHSGEHIVSGMLCARYGCDNVGFHLGKDTVVIDYNAEIDREGLAAVEAAANRYIWEDHEMVLLLPEEEELAELSFRSKKELHGDVRIVSFPGADTCACCGTHVRRSGEAGPVKFISLQHISRGSRIELLCGKRAFDFLSMNYGQNAEIGKAMAASLDRTAAVYQKQKEELIEAKIRLSELEKSCFGLIAEKHTGCGDLLLLREGLSPDSVRKLCVTAGAACGGLCAVFSGSGSSWKYAMTADPDHIKEIALSLNTALSGRGGGRDGFVQGSVNASRRQIEAYFKESFPGVTTG